MTTARKLPAVLNEIKTLRNAQLTPLTIIAEAGGFNDVRFYQVDHVTVKANHTSKPLVVAVVTIKKDLRHRSAWIQASIKAQQLLLQQNVPTDFNHILLYYNTQGIKISEKANCDLFQFVNKYAYTHSFLEIKRLITQLVLAMSDYHTRNIAHRDFRTENIFVFYKDGKYFLRIADQDSIIRVDNNGKNTHPVMKMTPAKGYRTPEYESTPERNLNWLALDCFALGVTIEILDTYLLAKNASDSIPQEERDALKKLIKSLKHPIWCRATIQEVLKNPFFGSTHALRQAYFHDIRAEAKHTLVIDGYPVNATYHQQNDAFFLLDHRLKPICISTRRITEKTAEFHCQLISVRPIRKRNLMIYQLKVLDFLFNQLQQQIKILLRSRSSTQTNNPHRLFSIDWKNIQNTAHTDQAELNKNTILTWLKK